MDPFWATVFGAGPGPREDLILTTYSPLLYVERSVDLQRATFRTPREEAKRNGQLFAQRAQASLSAPPTQSLFRQATNALPQPTFGGSEEK